MSFSLISRTLSGFSAVVFRQWFEGAHVMASKISLTRSRDHLTPFAFIPQTCVQHLLCFTSAFLSIVFSHCLFSHVLTTQRVSYTVICALNKKYASLVPWIDFSRVDSVWTDLNCLRTKFISFHTVHSSEDTRFTGTKGKASWRDAVEMYSLPKCVLVSFSCWIIQAFMTRTD